MTTFYTQFDHERVESVTVTLHVKFSNGGGESFEERHFSDLEHGRYEVSLMVGLIQNACALAGKRRLPED